MALTYADIHAAYEQGWSNGYESGAQNERAVILQTGCFSNGEPVVDELKKQSHVQEKRD